MSWCSPSDSPPADRSTMPPDRPTQQSQTRWFAGLDMVEVSLRAVGESGTDVVLRHFNPPGGEQDEHHMKGGIST